MSLRNRALAADRRQCREDSGTAILEFTLVAVLLLTIVFGIISFGLLLSFKQDVTRAAAEGARASAVALSSAVSGANDPRRLAGVTATAEAVTGFNKTCGVSGMQCVVQIHDCNYTVAANDLSATPDTNGYYANADDDCVTVKIIYDHKGFPLVTPMPLISAFLPDTVSARSVVRLNP